MSKSATTSHMLLGNLSLAKNIADRRQSIVTHLSEYLDDTEDGPFDVAITNGRYAKIDKHLLVEMLRKQIEILTRDLRNLGVNVP